MNQPRQKDCNYILIGICGYCGGRVSAASSIDGPLVTRPHSLELTFTPQCRDCGAAPANLVMKERRSYVEISGQPPDRRRRK